MKYFLHIQAPVCGCDGYDVIEADNELDAREYAEEQAIEHLSSFFDILEEEPDEDEEAIHGHDYILDQDVDYSLVEYNPDKHDGYIY